MLLQCSMCLIQAGQTPLQLAEEKKHMEIVHLLKTGVPAQPAGEGGREREGGEGKYSFLSIG